MANLQSLQLTTILIFLSVFTTFCQSKIFHRCDLARELRRHSVENVREWVCIAEVESGYNTSLRRQDLVSDDINGYGIFQITNNFWCSGGRRHTSTVNKCNLPCSQLLDDDISDDIRCLKIMYQAGFYKWNSWKSDCEKRDLSSYLSNCPGEEEISENHIRKNTVSSLSFPPIERCPLNHRRSLHSRNSCFRLPTRIGESCEILDDCKLVKGSECWEHTGEKRCGCSSSQRASSDNNSCIRMIPTIKGINNQEIGDMCEIQQDCRALNGSQCLTDMKGVKRCSCPDNYRPALDNKSCYKLATQIGGCCEVLSDCKLVEGSECWEYSGEKKCSCSSSQRSGLDRRSCYRLPTEIGGYCQIPEDCLKLRGTYCRTDRRSGAKLCTL